MKKLLNFFCILSIVGLSTSQVLSCNHQNNILKNNTKSNLNSSYYYEDSTKSKHSWDIHGLKKGNSLKNLKKAIYEYILKEYKTANPLKTSITLEDVKNDLSLKIFDQNQEITNVQNFRKYNVLITAKKNAKYFLGSNNKNKFIVDLTQLEFTPSILSKKLINIQKDKIKFNIESQIIDWYTKNEKSKSGSVPFNKNILEQNLKINLQKTKVNSAQNYSFNFHTLKKNDKYFFETKGTFNTTDYFGADFKNINLDKIYSAVNGQDLYQKVYTQAAILVNAFSNLVTNKVTYEDIKNDQNLHLTIFCKNTKKIIPDSQKTFAQDKPLVLKVKINDNDKYFLPLKQAKFKQFHLTKMNLVNLNYQNYDLKTASSFNLIKKQTARKLAWSYNQIFKTHLTKEDILKTKLSWTFYDKTKKKVIIPSKNVPDFNDNYTISLKIGKNNPYFDIKENKNIFKIADFTLNTNDLRKKFNVNNIKVLTSSKNLYDQVYTNLVNEYNHYYQGKRAKITIADLKKDKNLRLVIRNRFTQKELNRNDDTNSLKIFTNFTIELNIYFNDLYFRWTHRPIFKNLCVYKLYTINRKFFDLNQKKYSFTKISQLRDYLYRQLANYYNSKLNIHFHKISGKTLINDKQIQIRVTNSSKKKTDEINFNSNVKYYLTTTNKDQYFGQFTNLKLNQFSYQQKIDLGTKQAQNYINNEEKFASNNKNVEKSDVFRWFLNYVNSTKQFHQKLTSSMVAPEKDSIRLLFNPRIQLFYKTFTFTIIVNNSPYLKTGKFTFSEKNFKYDTATMPDAILALQHAHWAYNDLWYHVYRTPTIADATNYIGVFELKRIYNTIVYMSHTVLLNFSDSIIHNWIKYGIIKILWTKDNDHKYLSPNYKITGYGPTHYQMFITVEKSNQLFSVWTKPVKLLDVFFTNYS